MQNLNEDLAGIRILIGEGVPLREEQRILWETMESEIRLSGYKLVTKEKLEEQIRIKAYCGTWEAFKIKQGIYFPESAQPVREIPVPQRYLFRKWLAVAAAIVVVVGTAIFLNRSVPWKKSEKQIIVEQHQDARQSVLYLADQSAVPLQYDQAVLPIKQGNTLVSVKPDGELQYNPGSAASGPDTGYNRMVIPRGGGYKVLLSDGTRVWLNTASQLKYPVSFGTGQRVVELTGEGYFEVAKNAAQPFIVKVNNAAIQVLGTHFNVSAYPDEQATATTVLEGAVRVSTGSQQVVLKPGQMAEVKEAGIRLEQGVDVDKITAWQKGFFYFNNDKLSDIMRTLERWYDVKVTYGEGVEDKRFMIGRIGRKEDINKPLTILTMTGSIHYKISEDGKEVLISK
jgi:ferric-dicitrate binding protein FerR (iron transport regulator)